TDTELQDNHVLKWLAEVDPFVPGGRWFAQKMEYHWPSPAWCWCPKQAVCVHSSITAFEHIDDNRGARKYQGTEFAVEAIDEATHFRAVDLEFLYTRVRAEESVRTPHVEIGPNGKRYDHPGWPGYRQLQVMTANPGDVGHQYMLENYVDPEEGMRSQSEHIRTIVDGPHPILHPEHGTSRWEERITGPDGAERWLTVDVSQGKVWTVEIDLGSRGKTHVKRAFVPARLEDNPSLDPLEYAATLAVGSAENRHRLLEGDWTYAEDRVFMALNRDTHLVDGRRIFGETASGATRPPPKSWPRGAGQDHGTTKPTACVLVCLEDEGFLVAYREYYSPGPTGQHVRAIREMLQWDGHPDLTIEVDPRLFHRNSGIDTMISVADIYRFAGEPPTDPIERKMAQARGLNIRKSNSEDRAALDSMLDMIEPGERTFPYWHERAGQPGAPLLFITEDCPNLWRELIALRHGGRGDDGLYTEGVKTGQADHGFDAIKRIAEPLRRRVITPARGGPRYVLEAV
ncbi:MAG: hypothetical protein O2976_05585, partial [Actinomycetota bacterium]|nr:hypothetical protein [Actinomycetota bacterium]